MSQNLSSAAVVVGALRVNNMKSQAAKGWGWDDLSQY